MTDFQQAQINKAFSEMKPSRRQPKVHNAPPSSWDQLAEEIRQIRQERQHPAATTAST